MTEPQDDRRMSPQNDQAAAIRDAANSWFLLLGQPGVSVSEKDAFRRWLAEDPRHETAFRASQQLWRELEGPARRLGAGGWYRRKAPSGFMAQCRRFAQPMAGLAVLLLVVGGIAQWRDTGLIDRAFADEAAAPGELREFLLPDGSRAVLDGNSAIRIDMAGRERRIVLMRGRIWVDVVADPARPFSITSDELTATALGTAFGVEHAAERTTVIVERGEVGVDGAAGGNARLSAGETIVANGRQLSAPLPSDLNVSMAWRHGLVVFDRATLGAVIDEIGTMRSGRILLGDQSLRDLRLSGVFRKNDPRAVLDAMHAALGLKSAGIDGLAVVLYR